MSRFRSSLLVFLLLRLVVGSFSQPTTAAVEDAAVAVVDAAVEDAAVVAKNPIDTPVDADVVAKDPVDADVVAKDPIDTAADKKAEAIAPHVAATTAVKATAAMAGLSPTERAAEEAKPQADKALEEVVYSGALPMACLSPKVSYSSEVLTDFIPIFGESRQCQQACQSHGECYFWTHYQGKKSDLAKIPADGEEVELYVPEYNADEAQRRALAFADFTPAAQPLRRLRNLKKAPTAEEVLADPPSGACFLFGPYVQTRAADKYVSGPRTCADECSPLYSSNCKYSRCCSRATATCVSKDSFFAQCRLPTDACPGRGWNCYNISSTPLGCLEYDTEYAPDVFGNDLEEILDVPTELHCQELCKNSPKCNYWSYNPWYKHMCLLKKKNRPKRASKGIISGAKECAGFSQPETLYYLEEAPEYATFFALVQKAGLLEYIEEKTRGADDEEDTTTTETDDIPPTSTTITKKKIDTTTTKKPSPLQNKKGITLLIPTNTAWEKLPASIERKLKSSEDMLKKLMLYHMIEQPIWIERTMGDKTFTAVKSASGDDIGLSRRASAGGALRINDADVLIMDLRTKDGMISLITDVLIPPSMMDTDAVDGSLDSLDGDGVDGKQRAKGISSLLEDSSASTKALLSGEKDVVKKTEVASTTVAPKIATRTKKSNKKTQAETTTSTIERTTSTSERPVVSIKKPTVSEEASTVMDTVILSKPTDLPKGLDTLGADSLKETNADASTSSVKLADDSVPAITDRGIKTDESEESEDSSSGMLGLGVAVEVVLFIILVALLAAGAFGLYMLYNARKAKCLDEPAMSAGNAPRIDYASR
eukprot:TRINITY_DN12563_c0_g2_i3.p1 TRINITY_DN12563_c0_g2~~TRINITY_DN12563_c0_g2_i3.p1  ORF type:complete len:824 (-),score=176.74 TRINITY_DN12563_c0_g2_i3:241-2712(-)